MDRRRFAKGGLAAAVMLSALLFAGTTYVAHAVVRKPNVSGLYRDRVVSRVRVARDVYGSMDLFTPADGGPSRRPVVVWTRAGTSSPTESLEADAYPQDFAERGYASASVGRAQDVAAAVAWLRAHAGEYGIDASKVFVAGFAAHAPGDAPVLVLDDGSRHERITYEGHGDDVVYTDVDGVAKKASDFFASAVAAH